MEQGVWIAFGIIATVIGFSVVVGLFNDNKDEIKSIKFSESLELLKHQCDLVCDSPIETKLSADVELPSGLKLYTLEKRICGDLNISEEIETKCLICKCKVNGTLNLDTITAREAFSLHSYSCYFTHGENEIKMECKG